MVNRALNMSVSNKFTLAGYTSDNIKIKNRNEVIKRGFCRKCGAWCGHLGLEPTLDLYIKHMLQITAELKRVLKKTGVFFLNWGDCYGANETRVISQKCKALQNYRAIIRMVDEQDWILRNIIIWHKSNALPSSVRDRFANTYEPVFMLVKNKKYYFDLDAVRVPHKEDHWMSKKPEKQKKPYSKKYHSANLMSKGYIENHPLGKNPGDLWTIPTQPFPEAHFATFGEKLVEPMILAGCPQWVCKKCGKPRMRILKTEYTKEGAHAGKIDGVVSNKLKNDKLSNPGCQNMRYGRANAKTCTIGWSDCGCGVGWDAGIVLDPFFGSGTTGIVAYKYDRKFIGIELNPKYCEMAKTRIEKETKQLKLFA